MITLQERRHSSEPYFGHNVTVKSPIGNFEVGNTLNVHMMKMAGRIYQPGKKLDGKFIDTTGKPDERIMVFTVSGQFYATGTKAELDNAFEERF
jgi:hypothetical protein